MSLTDRESHFEFGANWRDYAKTLDSERISRAAEGLRKLFPEGLEGKQFLDIGSGSGVHSLSALNAGAKFVTAIDIDENSVATTRSVLTEHAPGGPWACYQASIFDVPSQVAKKYDVVYSWGVLHHTGDMWRAIEAASQLVANDGLFCIAIYAATRSEKFWVYEKRLYTKAPRWAQMIATQLYTASYLLGKAVRGVNPIAFLKEYHTNRGMNFSHDAHDWLGGYPYEAAREEELRSRISKLGFSEVRSFPLPYTFGLFGAGCHEFVFKKVTPSAALG